MVLRLRVVAFVVVMVIAAPVTAQTLRVTAATTNLRAKPAADADIVATLTKGAELEMIGQEGAWYRVRVKPSGVEGFVHSLVVETIGTPAPPGGTQTTPTTPAQPVRPTEPAPGGRPASQPVPVSAPVERPYFVRVFGGLWSGGNTTGFGLGGGVAGRPFGNDQAEVLGDFAWVRAQATNGYVGSADFLWNFDLSGQNFTPAGGAGMVFATATFKELVLGFQLLGSLEVPISDRRAFRGEVRFKFFSGGTVIGLFGGLSF